MDFYYYSVEVWLSHRNTVQHCIVVCLVQKHPVFAERSYNKKQFFRELTDGSENPTNTDSSYCACHSKSIKVDEYIAAVPVNSRRSGAVVTVQHPQLAAKPGDGNVASNWSGCYLRTAGCMNQKKKTKHTMKDLCSWRQPLPQKKKKKKNSLRKMSGEMPMQPKDKSVLNKSRLWSPGLNTPTSFSRILLL